MMIRRIVLGVGLIAAASLAQAQGVPGTDIYLAPLSVAHADGKTIGIGTPQNITRRPGYDNQPAFMGDERAIYYTSIRGDGQADIYRYDIASHATSRVTTTSESEYSPTLMPGGSNGARFSVIRVEPDSTQRLWSFALDGSDPQLVIKSVKPVGYHAWLDAMHVATYVLGRPATLQVVTTGSEKVDTAAQNIGRSLSTISAGAASFVQPKAGSRGSFTLEKVALGREGKAIVTHLGALPDSAEFVVWTPSGVAVTAAGSKVYARDPATREWSVAADLAGEGIRHITRLAVSPNGHWLALVADDQP